MSNNQIKATMAITQDRTAIPAAKEPFWRKEVKMLPGGFKFKQTFPVGSIIRKATPLFVDFSDMSAAVVKVAKVLAGGTTTKPRVAKGHNFVAGDSVTIYGTGTVTKTVSSVDYSNDAYDVLTLNSALTGATENAFIVEPSLEPGYYDAESGTVGALKVVASDASTGEINLASVTPYKGTKELAANDYVVLKAADTAYVPNMVLGADVEIKQQGLFTLDAAFDAVVLKSIAAPFPESWLIEGGAALKTNPRIMYINQ